MNKRIKKKWLRIEALTNKVVQLMAEDVLLAERLKNQVKVLEELENRVNANALASNNRFDQLEAENKALRIDLDNAVFEFKKPKRSLFSRK